MEGSPFTEGIWGTSVPTLMGSPKCYDNSTVFRKKPLSVSRHTDSCSNCVQKQKLFHGVHAKGGAVFRTPPCTLPHVP